MIVDPNKPIAFIPIEDACPESFVQFGDLVEPPVGGGRVTIPTSLTPSLTDGGPTLTFITLSPATFEIERSAQLERHPNGQIAYGRFEPDRVKRLYYERGLGTSA